MKRASFGFLIIKIPNKILKWALSVQRLNTTMLREPVFSFFKAL